MVKTNTPTVDALLGVGSQTGAEYGRGVFVAEGGVVTGTGYLESSSEEVLVSVGLVAVEHRLSRTRVISLAHTGLAARGLILAL